MFFVSGRSALTPAGEHRSHLVGVSSVALVEDKLRQDMKPRPAALDRRDQAESGARRGGGDDETQEFEGKAGRVEGTAKLWQALGEMDHVKRAAESHQGRRRFGEVGEREGEFVPGAGAADVGRGRTGAGPAERRVGDHAVKVFRREKARRLAQVAADDAAAIVQGVGARIFRSVVREIALELDADNMHCGVAPREKQPDDADAGAEIEDALPRSRLGKGGEQERIETVPIAAFGLREGQPAVALIGSGQRAERVRVSRQARADGVSARLRCRGEQREAARRAGRSLPRLPRAARR